MKVERKRHIFTMREVLAIIFKHKYEILAIFSSIVLITAVYTYSLPDIYQATSSLLVKFGREWTYREEVGNKETNVSYLSYERAAAINADIKVITSEDLAKKVVSTMGVEKIFPDMVVNPGNEEKALEGAARRLSGSIEAKNYKNSNVVDVSLDHKNPQIAADVLNLLIDFFQERRLEVLNKPRSAFLEKQLTGYRQSLKQSEDDLEKFKQKYQVYNLDEQRSILLYQRREFDVSLKEALNKIEELQEKVSFLKKQKEYTPENIVLGIETNEGRNSIIDSSKSHLLSLKLKEKELLEKYKESSRLVANIRQQIQEVEEFLSQQEDPKANLSMGRNDVYKHIEMDIISTEADLTSTEAKVSIIQQQRDYYDQELQKIDLREKQLRSLKREIENNEINYKEYLSRYEEARISEDMDRQKLANISVIQEAIAPTGPIRPRRRTNIMVGILLGLGAGFGFSLLSEFYISQGLSTPAQVERVLGIPVLSTIPYKEQ